MHEAHAAQQRASKRCARLLRADRLQRREEARLREISAAAAANAGAAAERIAKLVSRRLSIERRDEVPGSARDPPTITTRLCVATTLELPARRDRSLRRRSVLAGPFVLCPAATTWSERWLVVVHSSGGHTKKVAAREMCRLIHVRRASSQSSFAISVARRGSAAHGSRGRRWRRGRNMEP